MHMRRTAKLIPPVLFSALALTATFGSGACGSSDSSGDNGGGDAGKDGPIWTAPGAIVSFSPTENDDNVSVHAPIQIVYDEAVQVTPQSVSLSGPGSTIVATTVRLSEDRKTVTVTPVSDLVAPTTLTLTINDIRTADGAAAQTRSWSWTVPAWLKVGKPAPAKSQGPYQAATRLAIDSKDRISVFTDGDVAVNTIESARGDWTRRGGPLNGGQATSHQTVAVNRDGAPFVAFLANETHVQGLSDTSWLDLGGTTHGVPAGGFGGVVCGPSLAVEPTTGKLLLAHTVLVNDAGLKMYVESFANGRWAHEGDALNVSSDSATFPNIAASNTGKRYAMYQTLATPSTAYVLTWTGSGWSSVGAPASVGSFRSALTIDRDDKPVVFGCFPDLQFRRWDGSQWSTIGPAVGSCPSEAASAYVGRNDQGRIFAAWSIKQGDVHVAEVTAGGWTPLPTPAAFPSFGLVEGVVVDSTGIPVTSWGIDGGIQVVRSNK